MSIKIDSTNSKEIIALDTFTAVRMRPTMYVSQVSLMDEKLPIIKDGRLQLVDKCWSPGFMHLLVEILENSLDEAKRCKGKMKNINVKVNLDNNEVTVIDEGKGFHNAEKIHKTTKKNVVRTALEELHAGSNFIGSAVCNILSQYFKIETINDTYYVRYEWADFKVVDEEIRKKLSKERPGTSISFVPSEDIFPGFKWDIDLIKIYLSFKMFLIRQDFIISGLNLKCFFTKDGVESEVPISGDFLPKECISVNTTLGTLYLWESYENSCSLSFVNGSSCTGIHQKIVNDWCNEHFKYNLAHHFYETLVSLNVPSTLMRFQDQNKTRYAINRQEIEEELEKSFKGKLLRQLNKSEISKNIEKNIEDRLHNENINKIRKSQKQNKRRLSDKFSPASKHKDYIYLTEGASASGSVKQARNPESESVYALRGKVKNAKKLTDLANNVELLELINILNIEPGSDRLPEYKKVIIAADEDADGQSITALLINFFYRWFPNIVENKRLYRLVTPLVVCDFDKKRKYFYTLEEYETFIKEHRVSSINYLKGLGSLSLDDWQYVMNNKILFQINKDTQTDKYLEIAFGDNTYKRKKWLSD
jgi:topoisomerase-4 subunit B